MLSERLETIKKILNGNEEKSYNVVRQIDMLMKSDIISTALLARKAKITLKEAKDVIKYLVNQNELEFFIIVECANPNIKNSNNEIHHYKHFNSIREFNEFTKVEECPICGCGYSYDIDNAKIGFRRLSD